MTQIVPNRSQSNEIWEHPALKAESAKIELGHVEAPQEVVVRTWPHDKRRPVDTVYVKAPAKRQPEVPLCGCDGEYDHRIDGSKV